MDKALFFELSFARARPRGFTLIELMVAIGLLTVLGLMLITSVRRVVEMTADAGATSDALSSGAATLSEIESDLQHLHGGTQGRLCAGQDPMGRMFIAFVRSLPEERTTIGGYYSGTQRPSAGYDRSWRGETSDGSFRALGGLAETCYVMEPAVGSTRLFRGVVSPVSPPGSLDIDVNRSDGVIGDMEQWHYEAGTSTPAAAANLLRGYGFESNYHMIADNVLYLGFELWSDSTESWEASGALGAVSFWESLDDAGLWSRLGSSWPRRNPSQATLPSRDMGYPRAIRVSITVDYPVPRTLQTALAQPIGDKDTVIVVQSTDGFPQPGPGRNDNMIRVGDEWVVYGAIDGTAFSNCQRGARGTKALPHTPGASVRAGLNMSRVVTIPVGR